MPLSNSQKKVSDDPARFKVVVAGRRWGKTYLSINEIAKFGRYPNKKIVYVAPTFRMCRQILWDDIKQRFSDVRWVKKINESDLSITLVNNTKILLRGADNFDSLRGISIDFLIMDEAAMIDKKAWTEVLRPALSDRQGHGMFITTPKGFNWIKDLWDSAHTQDNWSAFQFTTLDGGNVAPEEILAAKNELDERSYIQEYLASFVNFSGLIYYNFDIKQNTDTPDPITDKDLLLVGMDFNRSPMTAAIATFRNGHLHIHDEIQIFNSNTFEMAEELKRRYPNNRIWVYPDASGANNKTSAIKSDHNILREYGFTIKSPNANPPVVDRIASVNAALLSAGGDVRLTLSGNCKNIIKSLQSHVYKEGTRIPDKDSGHDHFTDCVGYVTYGVMPIRRPTTDTGTDSKVWGMF